MDATTGVDMLAGTSDSLSIDPNETRQPLVIGVTVTALFLATVATALRVHVRALILRSWGWDDSALVASYFLALVTGLLMLINTHFGDGLHQATLSRENFFKTQEISIAAVAVYQATVPVIKSAFLLQYRRVFPLPAYQNLCIIFLAFIVAFGITQVVSLCLACIPLRSLWDLTVPGRCIALLDWWLIGSSINLATDVVIFVMPLPLLRTVPLPMRQKIVLMGTFGLGFFTCAISVVRITTLRKSSTSDDGTYNTVIAGIWSITELSCAIICVCVPTLRPLLGVQTPSARTRTYHRPNLGESADTELFTQSDGGVLSQKRRSREFSGLQPGGDPENVRTDLSESADVTPPPAVHVTPYDEDSPRKGTMISLTRVETEEGVRFLSFGSQELELSTPLKPPPRRHIDRGNTPEDGGYFGAVVWDSSGSPRAPDASPSTSRSDVRGKIESSGQSPEQ